MNLWSIVMLVAAGTVSAFASERIPAWRTEASLVHGASRENRRVPALVHRPGDGRLGVGRARSEEEPCLTTSTWS
jgi:hypothetical protein